MAKTRKAYDPRTGRDFVRLPDGSIHATDGSAIDCDTLVRMVKVFDRRARAAAGRRERDAALRGLGLVKVRGALGGIYWE